MQNRNVFAVIIGVGNYEEMHIANLPTYRMDLALMGTALESGLRVPSDNIRILAGNEHNGYVTTTALAHAIADFRGKLGSEDVFVFYFSGHGRDRNIIFSNGQVELQSVIDYVNQLHARSKLVILDCCYSGNFQSAGARNMRFEEYMSDFMGKGIAVLASSSADEVARLGPSGDHSMFTGALTSAINLNRNTKRIRISLNEIYDETTRLVAAWNKQNPGKEQQPVFRSSIGGTIFFQLKEKRPYNRMEISYENGRYRVVRVDPLGTAEAQRLAAFVIIFDRVEKNDLAEITKEIADHIRYAELYSSETSRTRLEGSPARVIWCYFGHDDSDIINSRYFAYTIWAADDEMKERFFKENRNTSVVDDINIYQNTNYEIIRKMQEPTKTRAEFIESNKKLLALIVSMAERFVYDLQEVSNKTRTIESMHNDYCEWIQAVQSRYIELSDEDVAPDDLHDWSEEIMNLAGWVCDLSILFEQSGDDGMDGKEEWLIKNTIKRYHESMERLRILEDELDWEEAP